MHKRNKQSEDLLTRRSFIKGSAGAVVAANCMSTLGLAKWACGQEAADTAVLARVPMRVLANAPYIDARINDHGPFTFELDTGSMNSPLARELAETMGFDSRPTVRTGQPTVFTVGSSTTLSSVKASFTSFANLWALPGTRIYGDIGQNALKDFVVEFDYAGGIFTVYDPAR